MNLQIHVDGGSRGNPGPAAVGVVIADAQSGKSLHEAGYFLGTTTNNVAEYRGLLRALRLAIPLEPDATIIHSDSQLMVRQITGEYRVKSDAIRPLHEQAQSLLLQLGGWQIKHVRREQNKRADELVNEAMDAGQDVITIDLSAGQAQDLDDAEGEPAKFPTWTLRFDEATGDACPAPCRAGETYEFGPTTPNGLCIFAARAAFAMVPALTGDRPTIPDCELICPRCGAHLTMRGGRD